MADRSVPGRSGTGTRWAQERLFTPRDYYRKMSMSERLEALRRALEDDGSPRGSANHEKTVDNYRKFLDKLRADRRVMDSS